MVTSQEILRILICSRDEVWHYYIFSKTTNAWHTKQINLNQIVEIESQLDTFTTMKRLESKVIDSTPLNNITSVSGTSNEPTQRQTTTLVLENTNFNLELVSSVSSRCCSNKSSSSSKCLLYQEMINDLCTCSLTELNADLVLPPCVAMQCNALPGGKRICTAVIHTSSVM